MMLYPPLAYLTASTWTLVTSGHVASITRRVAQTCWLPRTLGETPWALINKALAIRDFINFIDEDRALGLQFFHHVAVMDDLFAHIDRRPKGVQRNADDINGPHNSGAKTPGLQQ